MSIKTQTDVLPNIQIQNQPHAAPDVQKLFAKGVGAEVVKTMILSQLRQIQEADVDGRVFTRWLRAIHDSTNLTEANVRMLGFSPKMYFGHWLRDGSGRSIPPRAMRMTLLLALAQGAFLGYRKRATPDSLRVWAEVKLPEGVNRDSALPNQVSRMLFGECGRTYADLFVNLYPFNNQIGFAQFLWRCFCTGTLTEDQADQVMDILIGNGVTCSTFVKLPPIPGGGLDSIGLFTRLDNCDGMPKRIGRLLTDRKLRTPAKLMQLEGSLLDVDGFESATFSELCQVLAQAGYRVTDFPCLR